MKKVSQSIINRRIAEARKLLKREADARACASYAVVDVYGNIEYWCNDICHYRMRGENRSPAAVLDIHNKWKNVIPKKHHKQYKEIITYIIRDSVWKDAFLSNNPSNFMRHGVVLDVTKPTSYVFQAVVALRMAKERRVTVLPNWKVLKKAGVCDEIAFLVSNFFRAGAKGRSVMSVGGHSPFNNNNSPSKVFNLLYGDLSIFKKEQPFSDGNLWNVDGKLNIDVGTIRNEFLDLMTKGDFKKYVQKENVWGVVNRFINEKGFIALAKEVESMSKGSKK